MLSSFDREIFFLLNGSDSLLWDGVWWTVSQTWTWLLFYIVLLYIIIRYSGGWRTTLAIVSAIALCVLLSDRISSGIFKPLFERFRPSRDPEIASLVDIVNGYRGGRYGFVSSHAANTFGLAMFFSLFLNYVTCHSPLATYTRRLLLIFIWLWALFNSYSRIYLGVHYPGDILGGALVGMFSGWLCWSLLRWIECRWNQTIRLKEIQFPASAFVWILVCLIATMLMTPLIGKLLV